MLTPLAALVALSLAASAPADSLSASPARAPLRDLGRAARALGSDAWYVVTSPGRLDRNGAAWVAGTAAVTLVLMRNDEAIAAAFRRSRGHPLYDAILDVGDAVEPAGDVARNTKYYAAAMVVGYALGNRPLTVIPAQLVESHLVAGTLVSVGKEAFGRRRPYEGLGSREFWDEEGSSFPSGHASAAFELAAILSHHAHRRPVTVALYALATTIALQRIGDSRHWPSDVVLPAVTGGWIAHTIVKRGEARAFALAPCLSPAGAPGLRVVFRLGGGRAPLAPVVGPR